MLRPNDRPPSGSQRSTLSERRSRAALGTGFSLALVALLAFATLAVATARAGSQGHADRIASSLEQAR